MIFIQTRSAWSPTSNLSDAQGPSRAPGQSRGTLAVMCALALAAVAGCDGAESTGSLDDTQTETGNGSTSSSASTGAGPGMGAGGDSSGSAGPELEALCPLPLDLGVGPLVAGKDETSAVKLGSKNDGFVGGFGGVFAGATAPGNDAWFRYAGVDKPTDLFGLFGAYAAATASVNSSEAARLCLYIECQSGGTSVECSGLGAEADISPEGRSGCCSTIAASPIPQVIEQDPNTLTADPTCSGDSTTTVYLRIRPLGALLCQPYVFQYGY